jgi:lon protease (S16) C-terminal proteolytic domain protein
MVAVVSSALFVLLAAGLILIPVPFVTWQPGQTVDVMGSTDEGPLIEISGIPTHNSGGKLLMTTVSVTPVDSSIGLAPALLAHIAADSDALPRDVVYPAGKSNAEVQNEAVAMMDSSRVKATVAALRAAGQAVTEMPMVSSVSLSGPANGQLRPGDLIEAVDGSEVTTNDDVKTAIQTRAVGDPVVFQVMRGGTSETVTVTTTTERDGAPYVGISLSVGYRYAPSVSYRIDPGIVGPSAGLVFALAIYDRITDGVLREGRVVAGTGEVDAMGKVTPIGGIREKIKGAEAAGATLFLMPSGNCADLGDLHTNLRLVAVGTLKDAIAALQLINEGQSTQGVSGCD